VIVLRRLGLVRAVYADFAQVHILEEVHVDRASRRSDGDQLTSETGKPRCLGKDQGQSGTLQHDVGPILRAAIDDFLTQVGHVRGVDAGVAGVLAGPIYAELVQVDADDRRGPAEPRQLTA